MMTADERAILLERLLEALHRGIVTVELVNWFPGQPWHLMYGAGIPLPTITARIREYEPRNGVWLYWWHWRQPIQTLDDLKPIVERFCDVVLAVEGRQ
jgi:hypothetical protein